MNRHIWPGLLVAIMWVVVGCSTTAPSPTPAHPDATDWAVLSNMMLSQTPAAVTVTPVVWSELPLVTTVGNNYIGLIPAGWDQQPSSEPDLVWFAPADNDGFGFQVRLVGSDYDLGVLDALLNNEIQLMRQEGLAPQEVGLRRPADLFGGVGSGHLADFTITLPDESGWLRLAALLTDTGTAYVFRLWGPTSGANQMNYTQALQRIVQAFRPTVNDAALVAEVAVTPATEPPPSPEAAVATPLRTLVGSPDPNATPPPTFEVRRVTLNPEPYRAETFMLYYPDGWFPTQGVAGMINFLDTSPNALVGISAQPLGTGYDPTQDDAAVLLAEYLDEIQAAIPEAVMGDQQVMENPGGGAVSGISTTYVVPVDRGQLVYRVTVLVTTNETGAAYRLVQWSPYETYEAQYRDLYRLVVGGFRPLSAADQSTGEDTP